MQQQFREPRIDLSSEFHSLDTIRELPAMPKQSSYSGMANTHPNWHDSLPQIRKVEQPPYWDAPQKQPLDLEKLTGRTFIIAMALVTLVFAAIYLVKLLQFSMAVTIK